MKNYVITGATSGIGRSTAVEIAKQGERVVILGRNSKKGETIANGLRRRFGNPEVFFFPVDLAAFDQVRRIAAEIKNICPVVDVLINNAGARYDDFLLSENGYEMSFAGNHLGHFLLTLLLQETIKKSTNGRVVVVSSVAHRRVEKPVEWIDDSLSFDRWNAYSKSKLANTIFALDLAERLEKSNITCNAIDPGLVASNFARNNGLAPWAKHIAWALYKRLLRSPKKAASEIIEVASSDTFADVTGQYIHENNTIEPSPLATDDDLSEELWNLSLQCVGLKHKDPETAGIGNERHVAGKE